MIALTCLRYGVLVFENDWYASSFGLECLIEPTLGIELNVQIAICGSCGVWWQRGHRSCNGSDGSVATSSVGAWQIGGEALLKLAVNVDDVFVLIELIFAILGLLILLLTWSLCTGQRLRLVQSLKILLLYPALAPREGISILLLLLLRSVVIVGTSQHSHFIC